MIRRLAFLVLVDYKVVFFALKRGGAKHYVDYVVLYHPERLN